MLYSKLFRSGERHVRHTLRGLKRKATAETQHTHYNIDSPLGRVGEQCCRVGENCCNGMPKMHNVTTPELRRDPYRAAPLASVLRAFGCISTVFRG